MDIHQVLGAILGSPALSGIIFGGLAKAIHDALTHLPNATTNKNVAFVLQLAYVILGALMPILNQMLTGGSAMPTDADIQQSLQLIAGMFTAHFALSDKKLIDIAKKK